MISRSSTASNSSTPALLAVSCAVLLAGCAPGDLGPIATVPSVNFGDDLGNWPRDGECDDPRFVGSGMADDGGNLDNMGRDATDCSAAYEAGTIQLNSLILTAGGTVNFGNNSGAWARDGECDDLRFVGDGMAEVLDGIDIGADADDCRALYQDGRISLDGTLLTDPLARVPLDESPPAVEILQAVDFGDDSSQWPRDGECDDPRFVGSGMADDGGSRDNLGGDATDCAAAYEAGTIQLNSLLLTDGGSVIFGNNSGEWARDGECDDLRFVGDGMAAVLMGSHIGADADDCRALYQDGRIFWDDTLLTDPLARVPLDEPPPAVEILQAVDFGDDSSQWARDGECDDWRFVRADGSSAMLVEDMGTDRSDCMEAWRSGEVTLHPVIGEMTGQVNFGDNSGEWANDGECDDPRFLGNGVAALLLVESLGRDAADCWLLVSQGEIQLHPLLGG